MVSWIDYYNLTYVTKQFIIPQSSKMIKFVFVMIKNTFLYLGVVPQILASVERYNRMRFTTHDMDYSFLVFVWLSAIVAAV